MLLVLILSVLTLNSQVFLHEISPTSEEKVSKENSEPTQAEEDISFLAITRKYPKCVNDEFVRAACHRFHQFHFYENYRQALALLEGVGDTDALDQWQCLRYGYQIRSTYLFIN